MTSPQKHIVYRNLKHGSPPETKRKSIFSTSDSVEHSTKVSNVVCTKRVSFFNGEKGSTPRQDFYGNLIMKGTKTHKVSFIDNVSNKKIAEVIMVSPTVDPKKDRVALNCASSCLIF